MPAGGGAERTCGTEKAAEASGACAARGALCAAAAAAAGAEPGATRDGPAHGSPPLHSPGRGVLRRCLVAGWTREAITHPPLGSPGGGGAGSASGKANAGEAAALPAPVCVWRRRCPVTFPEHPPNIGQEASLSRGRAAGMVAGQCLPRDAVTEQLDRAGRVSGRPTLWCGRAWRLLLGEREPCAPKIRTHISKNLRCSKWVE
ncbi:uncharacterized protein LOC115598072 [Calypte anna]|uniref:uncharacterized protein LOC115598072 n=1 Tax=Calypte anna TaxID=9244 RepID=UPI0011C42991|nr:uncharacterized protein LOC115598072 [Calypte anna]